MIDERGLEHISFHRRLETQSRDEEVFPLITAERGLGKSFDGDDQNPGERFMVYAQLIQYGLGRFNVRVTDHPEQESLSRREVYLFGEPVPETVAERSYKNLEEEAPFLID